MSSAPVCDLDLGQLGDQVPDRAGVTGAAGAQSERAAQLVVVPRDHARDRARCRSWPRPARWRWSCARRPWGWRTRSPWTRRARAAGPRGPGRPGAHRPGMRATPGPVQGAGPERPPRPTAGTKRAGRATPARRRYTATGRAWWPCRTRCPAARTRMRPAPHRDRARKRRRRGRRCSAPTRAPRHGRGSSANARSTRRPPGPTRCRSPLALPPRSATVDLADARCGQRAPRPRVPPARLRIVRRFATPRTRFRMTEPLQMPPRTR